VLLQDTLAAVFEQPLLPPAPAPEVERELAASITLRRSHAIVMTGVRRSGKSTLQRQLMRRHRNSLYCNFEDTRLFGMGTDDFPTVLALIDEMSPAHAPVFLDEVQAVAGWQRLVRTLVDRARPVSVTGSNASLLGRELGSLLTGRHLSFEVFPFSYSEALEFTGEAPGPDSFRRWLDSGGFPAFLHSPDDMVLQELLHDVVQRDVAARHRLRDTHHVMNVLLFLLANTGQPVSLQRLTKALGVPTVAQTSRYVEFLEDAYLVFSAPKFSRAFRQRASGAVRYYSIDNGLRRANSPQRQPDLGHRLENAVAIHLRHRGIQPEHAGERDAWECDFVTRDEALQVTMALTVDNRRREVRGAVEGARLARARHARILTFDQADHLREEGIEVLVVPAWQWMTER
jgi:hypothetical protein